MVFVEAGVRKAREIRDVSKPARTVRQYAGEPHSLRGAAGAAGGRTARAGPVTRPSARDAAASANGPRGAAPRRAAVRLPRERRVRDILDAAREVFCERGFADAAVSEIAARAGVVEGTIYKYFASKRELLVKVLERWYDELLAGYARELPGVRGLRARLRYVIWRHLRTIRDDPQLARLMLVEMRADDGHPGSVLHVLDRRYTAMLTGVLDEGAAAGELRAGVPARVVRDLVYGGVEHLAWRQPSGRGTLDVERECDDLLGVLWQGIAAGAARPDAAADAGTLARQLRRLERVAERLEAGAPASVAPKQRERD